MSTNVTFNGSTYAIPAEGDSGWGPVLSNYFIAIASGALQKSGGAFTLTSEIDFGATYGVKSAYLKSRATNPSGTGIVRLGNTEAVSWRNAANNADLALAVSASNVLQFNGASLLVAGAASIVNADVSASAAIAYSKLNLTGAILNADLAGSIAYSKLALTGAVLNADLAGSIAYSKLVLTGAILNADLAGSIAASKLVGTDIATVGTITSGTWSGTTIAVNKGGTGLTSGTSGGVLYYSASGTLASSGALAQYGVVVGGGAGAAPVTIAPDASTTKVLTSGGTGANPTWADVPAAAYASQAEQEAGSITNKAVNPGVQQYHPSACKCWVDYTSITTTSILASYNITSLTDGGTGATTITIGTDFSSANYGIGLSSVDNGSGAGCLAITTGGRAAGSVGVLTITPSTLAAVDSAHVGVVMFGDQ